MARSFRFLRTLGEGAFGAVHLAEVHDSDTDFVQTLAVKWLHERWSQSAEYAKRLRDEARLLALLRHESIVRVHGLTRIDGRLAILMEPIDGADLGQIGRMPPRAALEVASAVADALDAAWSETPPGQEAPLHVVHRDIKPSNVMVTPRGAVKVMDFGVARATFDSREAETRSQQFGTARYMAPERWLEGVSEAPSDVFSLGVTLLELVTGQPMAQPRLSREGFEADLEQAMAPLADQPELLALLRTTVAFDPGKRPAAAALANQLDALAPTVDGPGLRAWAPDAVTGLRNKGVVDSLTGTVVQEQSNAPGDTLDWDSTDGLLVGPNPGTATVPDELPAPPPPSSDSRRRWPILALGLLGLSLVGVAASGIGQAPSEQPSDPEPLLTAPTPTAPEPAADTVLDGVLEPVLDPPPEPAKQPPAVPAPVPGPAPQPAPAVLPAPTPEPEDAADPVPEPAVGTVRFSVPEGVAVETSAKTITQRRDAVSLPQGVAKITVVRGDTRRPCQILVGSSLTEVRIGDDLGCAQSN